MRAIVLLIVNAEEVSTGQQNEEFLALAKSADYSLIDVQLCKIRRINPAFYIGKGQLEKTITLCKQYKPNCIVVNQELSARFTRNLQKETCCNIIDRTELILRIFEQRALSYAGKLQVELAKLRYMATKLVRGWTHLERQRGGIGLRAGPGEKQIETDRRILRENINRTEKKIKKLHRTRKLNRAKRERNQVFVIAIVGYTNAGKSSLFNALTSANNMQDSRLFATLDPSTRVLQLKEHHPQKIVMIDTVGFIEEMPSALTQAFHATLEELEDADLLMHVIDCSDPEHTRKRIAVEHTLKKEISIDKPELVVYNKIDQCRSKDNTTEQKDVDIDSSKAAVAHPHSHTINRDHKHNEHSIYTSIHEPDSIDQLRSRLLTLATSTTDEL